MPADWPDFPHHSLIAQYFNDYVDHFGLRRLVQFNTPVTDGAPQWPLGLGRDDAARDEAPTAMSLSPTAITGRPNRPVWPGSSMARIIHAHDYKTPFEPVDTIGKRVLVVGMGNSAVDIASELGQRAITEKLLGLDPPRRLGAAQIFNGKPARQDAAAGVDAAAAGAQAGGARAIVKAVGRMEDYGLPTPDHQPLEAHPTVSGEFLTRMSNGDIAIKPAIERLDGA